MTPSWWKVLDVSDWALEGEEKRGRREKVWICDPGGARWLRKRPRASRPGEIAIEAFALQLGRSVGLEVAEGHPCIFRDGTTVARGFVSHSFLASEEELTTADRLLQWIDQDYDANNYTLHTLKLVHDALYLEENLTRSTPLRAPFLRVLLFDAWIGNGDRHPQNWGVVESLIQPPPAIRPHVQARLAPMFDPAGCLGAELQDDHRLFASPSEERLERYVRHCGSGFGNGNRLISMDEALADLASWEGFAVALRQAVDAFQRALDTDVGSLLDDIPTDWLAAHRKDLACTLLHSRLRWLVTLVP